MSANISLSGSSPAGVTSMVSTGWACLCCAGLRTALLVVFTGAVRGALGAAFLAVLRAVGGASFTGSTKVRSAGPLRRAGVLARVMSHLSRGSRLGRCAVEGRQHPATEKRSPWRDEALCGARHHPRERFLIVIWLCLRPGEVPYLARMPSSSGSFAMALAALAGSMTRLTSGVPVRAKYWSLEIRPA